ncbi:MAG: MFS transporter [Dehalococcoidales bacterium]|nr:MFS transporter [Dehalococcoidales bacterium]
MANHKSSNKTSEPGFFYGYIIVLSAFLILMTVWGAQYSFGVFFKPVLNEFGWTRAETSGAYSLSMVLIGIFGVFTGRLNDRFGPRLVLTVCGLLVGLGYFLMSQISAIWQMYLLYGVLISAGISGMIVPLLSTVARWFVKKRGLASGFAATGVGVGTIIMPQLANYLISSYNWRTSYITVSVIVLTVTVAIAQFLKRDPGQIGLLAYGAETAKTEMPLLKARDVSVRKAIRSSRFWIICLIGFCASFGMQTVMVHIVAHATDIGISAAAAATVISVIGVVSIFNKLGLGSIIDRISSKRVVIIVFVSLVTSLLWLLPANDMWMLYLFAIMFGVSFGGYGVVQSPLIADYFELSGHGAIFGLVSFATQTGGAVGSLVAGRIFDINNSYYWAFILSAAIGTAGLILSTMLRPVCK